MTVAEAVVDDVVAVEGAGALPKSEDGSYISAVGEADFGVANPPGSRALGAVMAGKVVVRSTPGARCGGFGG